MTNRKTVYPPARKGVVSARYPLDRIALLEAAQHREGDTHLSDTLARMLDEGLERRGLLKRAA